eukprot:TRINITY_DN5836_c1_g1_i1.p1 TRINITY_DN5836_c1_g1~~TRINITY_DN5836_c1_g1_i1.p1  ORF type:complete len:666 (-),score=149.47 TRINITY_DN5836_c1_g1_i1:1927-3699(-)
MESFPDQVVELLELNAKLLAPNIRMVLVQCLILLRNRNLLSPTSLLSLFFKLFRCPDKRLREALHQHIVSDIKKCNKNKRNPTLNRTLQNFMYTMLQDDDAIAPRESLAVMIELYRKNIWNDAKTANVISTGIFSKDSKLISMTLNFFLVPNGQNDEEDDEEEWKDFRRRKADAYKKYAHQAHKKTKKRKRKLQEALQSIKRDRSKVTEDQYDIRKNFNYEAILNLNDPQTYAEKVFQVLKTCTHGFDLKISLMNYMSKLIHSHELVIDAYYSYLQKYAQPHQEHITHILVFLAQSCHPMVSPEVLEPLMLSIANSFVTDRRPDIVIAIGINTIREICTRCPLVMNKTLLKDLIQYKKSKDKGVMMAARSLIQLFRIIDPNMLPRKERGKDGAEHSQRKIKQFGQKKVFTNIPGVEKLDESLSESDEWEILSDSFESSDEWEEVDEGTETSEMMEDSTAESTTDYSNIATTRILTDDEFNKIKIIQSKKRKLEDLYDDEMDEDDIIGYVKRRKNTKEDRMNSIYEGRDEWSRKTKADKLSLTNKEKSKRKNYGMMRQKALTKMKRSSRTKAQIRLNHIERSKKGNSHRKW